VTEGERIGYSRSTRGQYDEVEPGGESRRATDTESNDGSMRVRKRKRKRSCERERVKSRNGEEC
jgi:hypothetical protein